MKNSIQTAKAWFANSKTNFKEFNRTEATKGLYTEIINLIDSGSVDDLKDLLQKKYNNLDLDYCNEDGLSLVYIALSSEVTVNKKAKIVKELIGYGAAIDVQSPIDGNTPLHIAAKSSYHKIAKILLNEGADRDTCNNDGESAIDLAIEQEDAKMLNVLGLDEPEIQTILGEEEEEAEFAYGTGSDEYGTGEHGVCYVGDNAIENI